ncbi:MFS transporter [Streptomyces sp. MZ04]|uniref:MFS transporter n=1 Tax=Streptomyces sp. MZ04 TaxID=2559236 RepID=UPI00107EAAB7|nr:MFS transporter [Streptomyces sp. MZ04]TGB14627.1 MFS transporter [Streptomyces sp. MZ04]
MIKDLIPPPGPPRGLALAQLVCRTGDGAYYICAALFFTRIVGISPVQMGLGLTVAWSVALALSVPLGHLADRTGPRGAAVVLFICAGLGVASYLFVSSFTMFLVGACVYAVAQRGGSAAQQAVLAGLVSGEEVTKVRAYVQSSYNAGLAVGAGLGGLALLVDRREAYYAVFALNALAFFAASLVLSRLPVVPPVPKQQAAEGGAGKSVFKDRPYVVVSLLNALLLLHIPLVDIALPLWISQHTAAPIWLLSVMFMLNTVAVVLFQVRVSRAVTGLHSATRHIFLGSVLLGVGCFVFALTSAGDSAWLAGGFLLVAVAVQALGEMMQAAGAWEVSFGLAPAGKHGQYQAFFGNGTTVAEMAGPLVLTGLIVYWGVPGWILLGVLFVVVAALMGPAVRWGERVRAAASPVPPDSTDNIGETVAS